MDVVKRILFLRPVWSLFVVIFLGALGSGLWELFLKRFLIYLADLFVSVMEFFYKGYADSLYQEVGHGSPTLLAYFPGIMILIAVVISSWLVLLMLNFILKRHELSAGNGDKEKLSNDLEKIVRFGGWLANHRKLVMTLFSICFIFTSFAYLQMLVSSTYNLLVVTYSERALDIIRPNISDSEFYKLKSEYRQVDSRATYEIFYDDLQNQAKVTNTSLPKFSPYFIDKK